jgi:hypothetical protein
MDISKQNKNLRNKSEDERPYCRWREDFRSNGLASRSNVGENKAAERMRQLVRFIMHAYKRKSEAS